MLLKGKVMLRHENGPSQSRILTRYSDLKNILGSHCFNTLSLPRSPLLWAVGKSPTTPARKLPPSMRAHLHLTDTLPLLQKQRPGYSPLEGSPLGLQFSPCTFLFEKFLRFFSKSVINNASKKTMFQHKNMFDL